MSQIITEKTCPLGHVCKKASDGKIEICAWLLTLKGQNPMTGEQVDKEECAIAAAPLLLVDRTKATWGATDSLSKLVNGLANAQNVLTNN